MHGLETLLIRLATTVASAAAKSVFAPKPRAGLVPDPVRPLPGAAGPDRLARVLGERIAARYAALPEHERLAAVAAVQDAFAAAGPLDAGRLFAADLDPERLAARLGSAPAGLAARAAELYGELLRLCCAHLVDQLTAEPSFPARAAVEQTRRSGALLREATGSGRAGSLAFEQRYADFVAEAHSRLELYGVTLGDRRRAEWPLETAYLSLTVSGRHEDGPGPEGVVDRAPVPVEQALAGAGRLVLRGQAGSGKSTLLQWLALNAARQSFGPGLADWNRCVPFVLRLRSFHTPDGLPLPQDFLSAAGVPLRAPDGWTEERLTSGRALLLVDGVDEVPQRLRGRTENWLRSLITAFPKARYVVTTRPAAVPEGWLATQDFTTYTLLPMERDDIRAFVRHWHEAARGECRSDAERDLLDRYQHGLDEAVSTRRDLARLATNPLMCALLCALNRDRRMHLPRARKELYDAALDMLLVRRDTEREITAVEGVDMSRDEQTALLQRLAYWLIRNGLTEAPRQEVVGLLDEWLAAMPQVRAQADAEQVYAHLLNRSGLLREPVTGAVDFVHRTFQDYLGAKAAVEARDFGVLVRNGQDDQWDDVVRMAVGHARVAERGRLLRQLLRRADKAPRHRERLVLLAAASLEHAPELDPAVRGEVEERAGGLMPPRTSKEADALARVGELVLELLPGPEGLSEREASAVVHTAQLVGGPAALRVIARFRGDTRGRVRSRLDDAWESFDVLEYFEAVLEESGGASHLLTVRSTEQLALLERLPLLSGLNLVGDHGLPAAVLERENLEFLGLVRNSRVGDLSRLRGLTRLRELSLHGCPAVTDLRMLHGLPLHRVFLYQPERRLSLAPLRELPELTHLTFDFAAAEARLDQMAFAPRLTGLGFFRQAAVTELTGLEALTRLRWLTVNEEHQWRAFLAAGVFSPLETLQILDVPRVDLAGVVPHQGLGSLHLTKAVEVEHIGALAELPALRSVEFARCGPLDLTPLTALDGVEVRLFDCERVAGAELFPRDRLIIH
ncbi:NACHT domain-containing protein [Streptomyces sp. SID161]|uniref:NACHT domain-containing protein n=1 Tax=Streptomyces sp. SID161 TaxID=2690251 RepID=UPI00136E3070|nr:NACHT domain-containing protein [Streptomyces sp. SID161]MYW47254.1 NACHT domain-containing protein [Streptomyces sp. SID161]